MRRAIELFAGAGGASLGILAAGYEEVRAVEWNHEACETRRAAGLRCDEGDVRDPVHYEGVGAIDLLWSSFPCQAWSTAGKRLGKDDPRNGWPWTVNVLDQVRPRWFLGENVAGLTHHRGACNGRCEDNCARLYLEGTILRQLGERFAWVGWRILDAARYGVPQNRERLILVAGPRPIEWPRETHAPPEELRAVGLFGDGRKPWRTVREALNLGGAIVRESGVGAEREPRSVDEPAYTMRVQHNGGGCGVSVVGIATAHKPGVRIDDRERVDLMDRPAWTVAADVGRNRGGAMQVIEDPKHPHARPELPAPMIRSGGSGHSSPPMWLNQTIGSSQTSGRKGGRVPCESPVDAPAPTVRANEGTGLTLNQTMPSWDAWFGEHASRGGSWCEYARLAGHPEDGYHPDGTPRRISPVPLPTWAKTTRAASRPELLDRPSPTVTAVGECKGSGDGGNPQKMQRASDALFLGAGIRRLTPAECAILQDFPESHPWRGTKTSIYAQIGNAVPPALARVMCEAVAKADR